MAKQDELTEKLNAIVKDARNPEGVRSVLAALFPKVADRLGTFSFGGRGEFRDREREHRISIGEFAPHYFRLDPDPSSWGAKEIDKLLSQDEPREAFALVDRRLKVSRERDRPRLRRQFLDALDKAFGAERVFTQAWLDAIVEAAPTYLIAKDDSPDLFAEDNDLRVRRAILHGLETLAPEEAARLLAHTLDTAQDISAISGLFRSLFGDLKVGGAPSGKEPSLIEAAGPDLRGRLLSRVRQLGQTGEIWDQASPDRLIWFWWGCNLEDEVRDFAARALDTRRGLAAFLDMPVQIVRSTQGNYESIGSGWSNIVDLNELAKRAAAASTDPNSDIRNKAIRFLSAKQNSERRD